MCIRDRFGGVRKRAIRSVSIPRRLLLSGALLDRTEFAMGVAVSSCAANAGKRARKPAEGEPSFYIRRSKWLQRNHPYSIFMVGTQVFCVFYRPDRSAKKGKQGYTDSCHPPPRLVRPDSRKGPNTPLSLIHISEPTRPY